MAIPAQGATVSFGGVSLVEPSLVEIEETFSEDVSRDGSWAANRGSVSISAYGQWSGSVSLGQRRQLIVQLPSAVAPGSPAVTLLEWDAIYTERKPSVEANDVVRFDYTFTIADTEDASA